MLFSVIFRSTATSALCALGLWLFFFILWPMIASAITTGFTPPQFRSVDEILSLEQLSSGLSRLSPGTLFGEAVLGLLNPETKAFGYFANLVMSQTRGMIPGTALPFDQSLLLIWPQITGLIAGMIVVFAAAYVIFQREEVRA
jgi:ABC-2 type transport system permease protein